MGENSKITLTVKCQELWNISRVADVDNDTS